MTDKKEVIVDKINLKECEYFKFRCPLDGEAKEGESWYDTH